MKPVPASAAALCTALVFFACEGFDRRDAPLPEHLAAHLLSGEPIDRGALRSGAWVVVSWSGGSEETVRHLRALQKVREQLEPRGLHVLALSTEPDESLAAKAASLYGLGELAAVPEGDTLEALGLSEAPATLFVRDGRIVGAARGPRSEKFLRTHALELLAR